ncbi:zinc finger protein OZF-like [Contarinia nasturtii]|uniref:zinc finger protein OZF-like n=1 Tax=Contarinia nasturtii TaxID=265458 RepID=UPI0012D4B7AB|nr:zinc finger protein OZF-like [Contarinia nasturtii]
MNPYRSKGTLDGKFKNHKCKRKPKKQQIEIKREIKEEPSDGAYLIPDTSSSPQITTNVVIKSESESDSEIDSENKPNYFKKEIKDEVECLKKECDTAKDGNGMKNDDQIGESSSASKRIPNKKHQNEGRAKQKKSKGAKMAKHSKKPTDSKHQKKHKCTFCNYVTSNKGHLTVHIRTHTDEKPFACEICAKAFAQKSNLKSHKKTHATEFPFSCSKCRQGFAHEIDKINHESECKHRQYQCHICKNTTHHLTDLKRHIRIHSGERPFRCRICAKTFTHKSHFTAHSRTHIKQLPFNCAQCGRRFADENEKQSHEDHCKHRRYDCYLCPYKCFYKTNLKRHMQVHHTGEKQFKCGVCGKKFIRKCHLKGHLATHSKQQPPRCSECFKPFTKETDKNAHEGRCKRRLHQCYLCKVLKRQSQDLKRHMRNYHTGE